MSTANRIPYESWTVTCEATWHGLDAHPISSSCRHPRTVERVPAVAQQGGES